MANYQINLLSPYDTESVTFSWEKRDCGLQYSSRSTKQIFSSLAYVLLNGRVPDFRLSEASDFGERSEPQLENLADIDWNCLLSKLLLFANANITCTVSKC